MVNCTVTITKRVDVLDHGHRGDTPAQSTQLYNGPAYFSSPNRSWQQIAALEGDLAGDVHVHTAAGLQHSTTVQLADHPLAGEYEVLAVASSGSGWRLTVGRRPHGGS